MTAEETTPQVRPQEVTSAGVNSPVESSTGSHSKAQNATPPKGFRLLSQEVEHVPHRFRAEWMKVYDLAIDSGEIEAVVINQEFEIKVGARHRTRPDEAIIETPSYSTWAKATLHRLEKSHAKGKLRVAVSLEELMSGQVNLSELANQNRELTSRTVHPKKRRATKRQASAKETTQGQRKSRQAKGNGDA